MTQFLPPNLLALFAPRDPIPFLPPIEKHAHHRKLPYTGVAQFLGEFEDPSETPAPVRIETREERKERKVWESKEKPKSYCKSLQHHVHGQTGKLWAYNVTFHKKYDTTEAKIRRELEVFGRINNVTHLFVNNVLYLYCLTWSPKKIPAAVKALNGRKIDGARVVTDIERGRTRPDWRPRRLGKGLGKNRQGPSDKSHRKHENGRASSRDRSYGRPISSAHIRDREKDHKRRRSRSRSKDRDRRARSLVIPNLMIMPFLLTGSRDRHRKRRTSDDRDRDHKRRDRRRDDMIQQYGEYGAEIRAEYNGDM
ncbi:unnamed protein product [Trichobilharzia regenti]|nr:unnamed protein product [Trichobilharzia regenti]